MLEEAFTYALRKNNWKYIETVEKDPPAWFANKDIESGLEKYDQLFNLKNDTGEQNNVAAENTDVLKDMKSILSQIKAKPSRPDYGK
jgi:arylsulfatase A